MRQFTVRTADQLPALLQALRKQVGVTQAETALRLGVTQQTYSALERNADRVGAARLIKLFAILGADFVVGVHDTGSDVATSAPPAESPSTTTPRKTRARPGTGQPEW